MEIIKKRTNIIGMKVARVWTPPPMPLARSEITKSGALIDVKISTGKSTKRAPTEMSKKSMKAPPRWIVIQKIMYITNKKTGNPKYLLTFITLTGPYLDCNKKTKIFYYNGYFLV